MHVLSQTMIRMIRDFVIPAKNIDDQVPFTKVTDKIDRLMDICNARNDRGLSFELPTAQVGV